MRLYLANNSGPIDAEDYSGQVPPKEASPSEEKPKESSDPPAE